MQPLKQGHGDGSKVTASLAQKNPDFHLYNAQTYGCVWKWCVPPKCISKGPYFRTNPNILSLLISTPPKNPQKITLRYPSTPYDISKPFSNHRSPTPTRCAPGAPGHLHHAVLHQEADGFTHTTTAREGHRRPPEKRPALKSPENPLTHCIGLRENLEETKVFTIKYRPFL